MSEKFQIKVSSKGVPYLEKAELMLGEAKHSSQLRTKETQSAYDNYDGAGIKIGLQENIFPYDLVISEMQEISNLAWKHYVFASLGEVYLSDLVEVAESIIRSQYVVFINPRSKQTQRMAHGHLIVKTE